jgi:hypothetical protein
MIFAVEKVLLLNDLQPQPNPITPACAYQAPRRYTCF